MVIYSDKQQIRTHWFTLSNLVFVYSEDPAFSLDFVTEREFSIGERCNKTMEIGEYYGQGPYYNFIYMRKEVS